MSEDPSRGSADRLNFNSVETCSSGVGSDYSERTQSQDELAVPDIPLEAQERGRIRMSEKTGSNPFTIVVLLRSESLQLYIFLRLYGLFSEKRLAKADV